jgi:high-affinity iron transporter
VARRPATLIFATEQLDLTLKHYRDGDPTGAKNFAIAAYLEGFEPMETSLSNLNVQLRLNIEQEMMSIRHLIYEGAPADKLAVNIENAKILLNQADELLREGKLTVIGAFASSLLILLQKGLVIILTLPTILVFVKRGERRSNALAYIHAGWVGAIFLGILTWLVVALLGGISGFSRTLISGVTTLAASAMLIYVCFWLNGKTHTPAWQQFLKDKVGTVLEKKALMMLALISFFIVYREIFETVLFYQALWAQTSNITRTALWAGAFTASLIMLTGIWGFFRIGIKLPFGLFFSGTSILFSIMTVIFTGLGLASLQVSGIVGASPVKFISLPLLGVFPTSQTLIAQAAVIGILILHQRISRLGPTP